MKKCVKFLTGVLTAFTLIASVFPTTPVNAETAKKTYGWNDITPETYEG